MTNAAAAMTPNALLTNSLLSTVNIQSYIKGDTLIHQEHPILTAVSATLRTRTSEIYISKTLRSTVIYKTTLYTKTQ